ncbi:MAG TPA: DUF1294 domain-containing protein [Burkholderiaceae bacterium]
MNFFAILLPVLFAGGLLFANWLARVPMAVLWFYLAVSGLTFLLYAFDKVAAMRGARRVPERTLHYWALAGGWPGALLAQQLVQHKRAKPSFVEWSWICAALNCFALFGVLYFLRWSGAYR